MANFVRLLTLLAPLSLLALSGKPEVVSGSADYEVNGSHEKVRVVDKTILQYTKLDVSDKERLSFIQPSAKSTLLCRVKGADASKIHGRLDANGRLLLINPNGIIFSKTATVNVGSLIASTADILNDDFLKGRLRFTLSPEAKESYIIHDGTITAERDVVLLAPQIWKEGKISAKLGQIALLGAEVVTIDFDGDQKMSFAIEAPLSEGGMEIGGVFSGNVSVGLHAAKEIIQQALQCDGLIEAGKIAIENGVVRLVESQKKPVMSEKGTVAIKANQIQVGSGITTKNTNIVLDGPVYLVGKNPIALKTGFVKGDVIFGSTLDAKSSSSSLMIQNGNGTVRFKGDIGTVGALGSLTVKSGETVFHANIGGAGPGVLGALHLQKKEVTCFGSVYHTGEQNWQATHIHMKHEGATKIKTDGQAVRFGGDAEIILEKTGSLSISTQGGAVDLAPIAAESVQSVEILACGGEVSFKEIGGSISLLHAEAKEIIFAGQIEGAEIFLEAEQKISYKEGLIATAIKSSGKMTLNSKLSSVGSLEYPIHIETGEDCFVGAKVAAYLKGSCIEFPQDYLPNPPPLKYFNGLIYDEPILEKSLSSLIPALSYRKSTPFIDAVVLEQKLPSLYYYEPK